MAELAKCPMPGCGKMTERTLLLNRINELKTKIGIQKRKIDQLQKHYGEQANENELWRQLIPILCRDGGHYLAEHGIEKTLEHCKQSWYDMMRKIEEQEIQLRNSVIRGGKGHNTDQFYEEEYWEHIW